MRSLVWLLVNAVMVSPSLTCSTLAERLWKVAGREDVGDKSRNAATKEQTTMCSAPPRPPLGRRDGSTPAESPGPRTSASRS